MMSLIIYCAVITVFLVYEFSSDIKLKEAFLYLASGIIFCVSLHKYKIIHIDSNPAKWILLFIFLGFVSLMWKLQHYFHMLTFEFRFLEEKIQKVQKIRFLGYLNLSVTITIICLIFTMFIYLS